MKTERRHDLETNELASRMARWIERFKPYTAHLTVAALGIVVLLALNSAWSSFSSARRESAWDAFALANYTNDQELMSLQRVAEDEEYAGTKMQEWAYITWADRQLLIASRLYLINRADAEDRLRRVAGIYEQWAANASDRQVRDRARFGLARVYELQNKPELASEQYALVQGDLQPLAAQRAEQIKSDRIKENLEWLATAELPRRDITGGSGASGARPNFDVQLPSSSPNAETGDQQSFEELLGVGLADEEDDSDRYEEQSDSEPATVSDEVTVEVDAEAPAEQ